MICSHLVSSSNSLDYIRVLPGDDPSQYETGMCEACDAVFWQEDGWTDRLFDFAGWKLFCASCYEGVLARHLLVHTGKLTGEQE
jgi:hypothetical protein